MAKSSGSPKHDAEEWSIHEIHRRIITPTSTEEKKQLYAAWAPIYNTDAANMGYEAPRASAELLYSYISKSGDGIRVLDVGCGTGLCGEHLRKLQGKQLIQLIGLDYSKDMLQLARARNVYDELVEADVNDNLEVEQVDFLLATGVFLEGHCEPSALPNVLRCLKENAVAVITVRNKSFLAREAEYLMWIDRGRGEVLDNQVLTYAEGFVKANYLVIRKRG